MCNFLHEVKDLSHLLITKNIIDYSVKNREQSNARLYRMTKGSGTVLNSACSLIEEERAVVNNMKVLYAQKFSCPYERQMILHSTLHGYMEVRFIKLGIINNEQLSDVNFVSNLKNTVELFGTWTKNVAPVNNNWVIHENNLKNLVNDAMLISGVSEFYRDKFGKDYE